MYLIMYVYPDENCKNTYCEADMFIKIYTRFIPYSITAMSNERLGAMMTSSNENIFRVTGHLCGEFTGPRWIPRTKASDAELWCFLWFASE